MIELLYGARCGLDLHGGLALLFCKFRSLALLSACSVSFKKLAEICSGPQGAAEQRNLGLSSSCAASVQFNARMAWLLRRL